MNRQRQVIRVVAVAVALFVIGGLRRRSSGDESKGSVTIYSGRTQNLIEPILKRFADETGIDVKVRYGQSADLALLIDEEGDKTPADLFISQSPGSVGIPRFQGPARQVARRVCSISCPRACTRAMAAGWACPVASGCSPSAEAQTRARCRRRSSTSPRANGKAASGSRPSNASFQDFVTAMRNAKGDEVTKQWLEGIAANDAFIYANNNAIVAAVDRGEIDVGSGQPLLPLPGAGRESVVQGQEPRLRARRPRQPAHRQRRRSDSRVQAQRRGGDNLPATC